jgi:hypothetical protein
MKHQCLQFLLHTGNGFDAVIGEQQVMSARTNSSSLYFFSQVRKCEGSEMTTAA